MEKNQKLPALPGLFPLPPTRPASVVPGLSTSAPRRGILVDRDAPQKRVTPQLRLRSRRCTSAHTNAPDGPGSQRSGPSSSRRRPAAARRLHRFPPISLREWRVGPKNLSGYKRSVQQRLSSSVRSLHGPRYFQSSFLSGLGSTRFSRIRLAVLFGPP